MKLSFHLHLRPLKRARLMIRHIFNSQTKTVTFAALVLGVSAFISRLLGLFRDRLLAGTFGAGEELDVYFAAFRIPDFVFSVLIMGGISAIFLPVFSEYLKKSEEDGWKLASNVLNCFLVLLIVICGILAIFTPFLIKFVTPGFNPEQKELVISLTRLMFLSPLLLGMSSLFSGVLHYFNRFFAYSIAPILYNLGIILGILVFVPRFGVQGLAYGVILGALLHLLVQLPAAKASGFKYMPIFNFRSLGLKRIFKLMIPRTIGTFAFNINLIIITAIGSTLAAGSIAIFNFANNIQHFPIGIIGASFALASFPVLSRAWVNGQKQEFLENFSSAFRQILFLIIPASVFIFLIRAQIVRLILGTGEFGWQETRLTAASLGLFCFGIFAFACIPFLSRVFYSFQDTKTPVIISLISMALSVTLCFSFVWLLGFSNSFQQFLVDNLKLSGIEEVAVIGLPLALSISAIFQFCLLLFFLRKKLKHIKLTEIRSSFAKTLPNFIEMETFAGILAQTIWTAIIGIFVYTIITNLLKSPETGVIKMSILNQLTKRT